ncbi:unnamed protein product, partial [Musa textilis]
RLAQRHHTNVHVQLFLLPLVVENLVPATISCHWRRPSTKRSKRAMSLHASLQLSRSSRSCLTQHCPKAQSLRSSTPILIQHPPNFFLFSCMREMFLLALEKVNGCTRNTPNS